MSLICTCPAAGTLTTIPKVTCPENFGQLQKVAFQRLKNEDGTYNYFEEGTGNTPIEVLANWTTLKAATDSTKIVISPFIYAPADSGGDVRLTSGGNDDLGGIPSVLGGNPVQFEGQLRAVPQDVIRIMKELQCEAEAGNLGVYLFDEHGNIQCIGDSPEYYPIPIRALYIGSLIHGNFDAKDYNVISWQYADNYSTQKDGLVIKKPDFNPLTDL